MMRWALLILATSCLLSCVHFSTRRIPRYEQGADAFLLTIEAPLSASSQRAIKHLRYKADIMGCDRLENIQSYKSMARGICVKYK